MDFDREFTDRYEFSLLGEESVDGEPAWILSPADRPLRRAKVDLLDQAALSRC